MSVSVTEPPIRSDEPRAGRFARRTTSRPLFRGFAFASGGLTLSVMGLIGLFLVIRSWDALRVAGFSFFTTSAWQPELGKFGVWARSSERS